MFDLMCFRRAARIFCLLTAYLDESYNNRTMCVGGWITSDHDWKGIEQKWSERIEYERRISAKKGLKYLRRYHATDCSNLENDFKGWDRPRQVRLTKKLIQIIKQGSPAGMGVGISYGELAKAFPEYEKKLDWFAYYFCMCECLAHIGEIMDEHFPYDKVTVIHDRGNFDSAATLAFSDIFTSILWGQRFGKYFLTIAPMGWENCTALQPADFIAYESWKMTDFHKQQRFDMRKSLQAIVGTKVPLKGGYFTQDGLLKLAQGLRNSQNDLHQEAVKLIGSQTLDDILGK